MDDRPDTPGTTVRGQPADLDIASQFHAVLLGVVGHDLRQPLQVLQTTYEWLCSRSMAQEDRARVARGQRAIANLSHQLDGVVGALRLFEQAKTMPIETFSLLPVLERCRSQHEGDAQRKGIQLHIAATSAHVVSNDALLSSILCNLVRNAVKFTGPGGRILVGCRQCGEDVRIDVYDTGIGISPERLPRLFKPFPNGNERTEGLGLGLFIARQAIELLGHRIVVRSIANQGSLFSVYAKRA